MDAQRLSQKARLIRRKGVYHYRRRVPDALVAAVGKREIHRSLGTASLAEAKKRRALEDLRWDARFQAIAFPNGAAPHPGASDGLSEAEALRLVQTYVSKLDENARHDALQNPPESDEERHNMRENVETGLAILQSRDDVRADEWIGAMVGTLLGNPLTATEGSIPAEAQNGSGIKSFRVALPASAVTVQPPPSER